jgi:hypothetical protein
MALRAMYQAKHINPARPGKRGRSGMNSAKYSSVANAEILHGTAYMLDTRVRKAEEDQRWKLTPG